MNSTVAWLEECADLRVILVGRTGLERSARRDARIEVIRVNHPLAAIGELGSGVDDDWSGTTAVVLAEEFARGQQGGGARECIAALRQVEPRAKVIAIISDGSRPPIDVDARLKPEASSDDLRAAAGLDGQPHEAEPAMSPAVPSADSGAGAIGSPSTGEVPTFQPDDRALCDALLHGAEVLAPALAAASAAMGDEEVAFVESSAGGPAPSPGDERCAIAVERSGHRFGWLVGRSTSVGQLEPAAAWLAGWLALGAQHEQLRHAAFTDALTGLLNERAFPRALNASLNQSIAHGGRTTLVVLQIEQCRTENARGAADEVVQQLSQSLRAVIRPGDRAFRLGRDRFALVLNGPAAHPRSPNVALIGLDDLGRRLSAQLQAQARGQQSGPEAHGGSWQLHGAVARHPDDGAAARELCTAAERRLHEAQESPCPLLRNGVFVRAIE